MVKSKVKAIEACSAFFEIEVPKERIQAALDEAYSQITKIANIPGFRMGKAPLELVKKYYSKDAREEALKRLIPECYESALKEHEVSPIGLPEISEVIFEEGMRLSFKARVDTRPKFKLKNYKGIKIVKKKAQALDADIEKALENLRELNAKYITIEDKPVEMGHYAVSVLDCFVDGKPIHKRRENLWIFIEKSSTMGPLNEKIVGMKIGEERDIEIALPKEYPDKAIAGKLARYHVRVKEIKRRLLPSLDDEFAKDLGKETLADLESEISAELARRAEIDAQIDLENQVLNKLMDDNDFKVPTNLVNRQLEMMVEGAKRRLLEKGFKIEDLDKKDNDFKAKFKDDAARRIRLLFILDEIASSEDIDASDDDLKNAYKAISLQTQKSETEVKDYYEKEDLVGTLRNKVREEKVIQFLLKNAQVNQGGLI